MIPPSPLYTASVNMSSAKIPVSGQSTSAAGVLHKPNNTPWTDEAKDSIASKFESTGKPSALAAMEPGRDEQVMVNELTRASTSDADGSTSTPPTASSDPNDSRPLFLRLKEKRMEVEARFAEAHRFANLIAKVEEEDIEYLANQEQELETRLRQAKQEELREMDAFRNAVLIDRTKEQMLSTTLLLPSKKSSSKSAVSSTSIKPHHTSDVQRSVLSSGIVVRKRQANQGHSSSTAISFKKQKDDDAISPSVLRAQSSTGSISSQGVIPSKSITKLLTTSVNKQASSKPLVANPLGVIATYDSSSDDDGTEK